MKRKALGLLGFASGVLAGSVLYRRTIARRRERVDVYLDDGTMVTLADGSPEAEQALSIARDALAASHA